MDIITKRTPFLLIPAVLLFLSACSTPYQEKGLTGGYSEQQLSERSYKVSFRGNGYTSSTKVQDFLMLRCAELTLKKGYKYFIVLDEDGDKSTSYNHDDFTETSYAVDKHTKSAQIFMANKKDLSEEEMKRAVNAKIYWENNQ